MAPSDPFNIADGYINDLFAPEDEALASALSRSRAAGLPEIQVAPGHGKLIYLLARMIGARHILEIGTLAGYSTIWLARALPEDGRLVTLEADPGRAEVAAENIRAADLESRVDIVVGPAIDTLPRIVEAATAPFDLVFLDADKTGYCDYLDLAMRCVRSGSLILGDNVIRAGAVAQAEPRDPSARGARAFNARIAADPRLEAIVIQQVGLKGHDGLAIARVR